MTHHTRRTVSAFLFAAAFFGATLHSCVAAQQTQETYRTLRRLPVEQNEPVTITMVAVQGQSIAANEKFLGSDDWLNGLTISLRNTSNKPIRFASIQLQFPRSDGSKGSLAVDDVFYGNRALLSQPPHSDMKSEMLISGKSVDVQVSANDFDRISRLLALTGYKGSIEEVAIRIGRIIFADDTMWYAGSSLQRDSSSPGTWTKLKAK